MKQTLKRLTWIERLVIALNAVVIGLDIATSHYALAFSQFTVLALFLVCFWWRIRFEDLENEHMRLQSAFIDSLTAHDD